MEQHPGAALQRAVRLDAVEAARGVCAGYVVLAHVLQILGYRYSLVADWPLLVDLFGYPHEAVLFFFLLSGFNIHYVSIDRELDSTASIRHYLYLRLRRIYPIFVLTVLGILGIFQLALLLELPHYQKLWSQWKWTDVWATLAFVADRQTACGRWFEVMQTNPPFWSLSYEMFYYLIYPLFHAFARRFGAGRAAAFGVLLSLASGALGTVDCGHITNVLSLYGYWCIGAWVAESLRRRQSITLPRALAYLLPWIGLLIIFSLMKSRLGNTDVLFWPLVLVPILAYPASTARMTRLNWRAQWLTWLAGACAALAVLALSRLKELSTDMPTFWHRLLIIGLAWSILLLADRQAWPAKAVRAAIPQLAKLGSISYALYLIHYPLLVFTREWASVSGLPSHSALAALPLIVVLAYWLETRLQPAVVRMHEGWRRRKRIAAPAT